MIRFLASILLILLVNITHAATVRVNNGVLEKPVGLYLEILEDAGGELDFKQVRDPKNNFLWKKNDSEAPNFAFSESIFWLRFKIEGDSGVPGDWYLEIAFPMQDYIDAYNWFAWLQSPISLYEVGY